MIAYDRLSQIIPSDIALANEALKVSLYQVSGITNMTLPIFANTVVNLQTTYNLPLVNQQTQPISGNTRAYYLNVLGAYGTGVCNSILMVDMLGTAIGTVINPAMANVVNSISTMNTAYLGNCYSTMLDCINGLFNQTANTGNATQDYIEIPVGYPGEGDYDTIDDAFTGAGASNVGNIGPGQGLIPVTQIELANLVAAYPTQTAQMNSDFDAICQQMGNEQDLQVRSGLDFGNYFANLVPNSQQSTMSFIFSLPGYGTDTISGGKAEFIEGIADYSPFTGTITAGSTTVTQVSTFTGVGPGNTISGQSIPSGTTLVSADPNTLSIVLSQAASDTAIDADLVSGNIGGQAVLGVMRQGYNQVLLNNAGILTGSDIPLAPSTLPPEANLYPTTYTAQQAANLVIK